MKNTPILVATIAVGIIGVCLVITAIVSRSGSGETDLLQRDLDAVQAKNRAVSAEMKTLKAMPDPATSAPADDTEALHQRIGELEAEVSVLKSDLARAHARAKAVAALRRELREQAKERYFKENFERVKRKPAEVLRLQTIAMDPSQPPEKRLEALGILRQQKDGITPQVADSMIRLMETSPDASVRRNILRQLHKSLPADSVAPVLRRLQTDSDNDVRGEAAETLGPFHNDPVVRSALEYASQNDTDEKVRKEAVDSLRGEND